MNLNQSCIFIGGLLTVCMGLFHTRFYRLFMWKDEFERITDGNRRIWYTVHTALYLLFFGLALVSLFYYRDLAELQGVSLGIIMVFAVFWLWRTVWQVLYFKPPKNRRLKKYRVMHTVMTVWFALLFMVYCIPILIVYI